MSIRETPTSRMSGNASGHVSAKPTAMPSGNYYTVLSEVEGVPFGFGSMSPARQEMKFPDVPGPGRYNPANPSFHVESIRGHGPGFTSYCRRRLEFTRGTKNPAPTNYSPKIVNRTLKTTIKSIPQGRRCLCYPDERESSITPGPAEYTIENQNRPKAQSSMFKSRVERSLWGEKPTKRVKFDGRTLIIQSNMF